MKVFQFKAILFDFDGLLVNSEPVWDKAYFKFLDSHGVKDQKEVSDKMTGMGLVEAVQLMKDELGLVGNLDELVLEHRKIFYEIFSKEKQILMPGASDLVEKCAFGGILVSLTSGGHTKEKLEEILEQVGIISYFSVVISSDDVKYGKPAPDVYFEALNKLNLNADDCLALEDSVNGVLAAKAAGITVYGVNANEKTRSGLIDSGANRVFNNLTEVEL